MRVICSILVVLFVTGIKLKIILKINKHSDPEPQRYHYVLVCTKHILVNCEFFNFPPEFYHRDDEKERRV